MSEITRKPLSWFKVKPQVRKSFDEEKLRRLGASLKVRQFMPVLAQPDGLLIAGECRLRAAQLVGLETLEVKIASRQLSDSETKLWQVQENVLRQDLTGYEKWVACTDLLGMNVEWRERDLAEHLHIDPSSITRWLSPSRCIAEAQDALKQGLIGLSDCYVLAKAEKPDRQQALLALKLSGASRDALEEAGRKVRSASAKPADKASRAQLVLASGIKIIVSGASICIDSLLEAFADAAKELRKAREQNLSIKTLQAVLSNKAKKRSGAMNPLKTLGLLVGRGPFVVGGVILSAALFVVSGLARLLRTLIPAIFSMLPPEWRHVIVLASQLPTLIPAVWSHFKTVRESCSHFPA